MRDPGHASHLSPGGNLQAQQKRFNAFRLEYNDERPHEALNQEPPATSLLPNVRRSAGRAAERPATFAPADTFAKPKARGPAPLQREVRPRSERAPYANLPR